jgi:hypothetical protein
VWDQKVETFLDLHERAFFDLGGVVEIIRHDYVPGNIIVVLCPSPLCGLRTTNTMLLRWCTASEEHNRLQRVEPGQ